MFLVACVNLPQLPLQIALHKNPDWKTFPVAVTKDSRPTSSILYLNKLAGEKGAILGSRYLDALGLIPDLRACEIQKGDLEMALAAMTSCLQDYSPEIEPVPFDQESIWLNARGMLPLFHSYDSWQEKIREGLKNLGFQARTALAFSRLGSYLAVKSSTAPGLSLSSPEQEKAVLLRASIDHLPLSDRSRKLLTRLGIRRVPELLNLPIDGTSRRFGEELGYLHSLLEQDQRVPVQAMEFVQDLRLKRRFDSALFSADRILEQIQPLLEDMVRQTSERAGQIAELGILFSYEDGSESEERLGLASPSTSIKTITKLLSLRLHSVRLPDRVEGISLIPRLVRSRAEQKDLFEATKGDLESIRQALAIIRARLGNDSVLRAELLDSHLPTKSYQWKPLEELKLTGRPSRKKQGEALLAAEPRMELDSASPIPILRIRRIHEDSGPRLRLSPRRFLGAGHRLSGLWWDGEEKEYRKSYCYYQDHEGQILWLVQDQQEAGWRIQGIVD